MSEPYNRRFWLVGVRMAQEGGRRGRRESSAVTLRLMLLMEPHRASNVNTARCGPALLSPANEP